MSLGYLALCGIFVGMIFVCFSFALVELKRPRDPGPLQIDVHRDINHRHFAGELRTLEPSANLVAGDLDEAWYVTGDLDVLANARVESIAADGTARIGEAAVVTGHADGREMLIVGAGASVHGRATSASTVEIGPAAQVRFVAAPLIVTTGLLPAEAPAAIAPWDPALDTDLEWLLSLGTPADTAIRDLELTSQAPIDALEAITRYERITLRPVALLDLAATFAPTWLGSSRAWYLGAGTIRVRGDLTLPEGAIVPFSLIVEGTLIAGAYTRIAGGVHAWEHASIGDGSRIGKSVTAREHVVLGDGVVVDECVSAGGDVVIGSRCWIGSDRNGGVSAGDIAEIGLGTVVNQKIYAENGARIAPFVGEPLTVLR